MDLGSNYGTWLIYHNLQLRLNLNKSILYFFLLNDHKFRRGHVAKLLHGPQKIGPSRCSGCGIKYGNSMILLSLGANLTGPWGDPQRTVNIALERLEYQDVHVISGSRLYATSAVGPGAQPDYVNAVIAVSSHRPPRALVAVLQAVEREAGRVRRRRWGARSLDLDLVAYHDVVLGWPGGRNPAEDLRPAQALPALAVPHPRLSERPFVIRPLLDVAPFWHHPVTRQSVSDLWQRLKRSRDGQILRDIGPFDRFAGRDRSGG